MSLFRRASWALPSLVDIYAHYSTTSDQTMGRAAAGLDPNTKDFTILPPRFKGSVVQALPNNAWSDVVVGYDSLEEHAKPVVEMLIASVVRHEDFLRKKLGANDPLFFSALYKDNLNERLKLHLLEECHVKCDVTKLRATGLQATNLILHSIGERSG